MDLNELLAWHLEQVAECKHEDEEEQRAFHLEAVAVLANLKLKLEGVGA